MVSPASLSSFFLSQVLPAPACGWKATTLAVVNTPKALYIRFSINGLNLCASRMRNTFSLRTDLCNIKMVRVVTFLVQVANGAVMSAVLSGGSTKVVSTVAVLSVTVIMPSSSSACTVAVPTFVCTFQSISIAILGHVAVHVHRRVTADIAVTSRGGIGTSRTISAIFFPSQPLFLREGLRDAPIWRI